MNSSCSPVFQAAGGVLVVDEGGESARVLVADRGDLGGFSVAVPPDADADFFDRLDAIGVRRSSERRQRLGG